MLTYDEHPVPLDQAAFECDHRVAITRARGAVRIAWRKAFPWGSGSPRILRFTFRRRSGIALAVIVWTDRFALSRTVREQYRPKRSLSSHIRDIVARIPIVALVYGGFFAISWRPLYGLAGAVSWFTIFTVVSRVKYEFIREPLLFSDLALIMDLFRHKEMFYATWLNIIFWVVALGYVVGATALFMAFEPAQLPEAHRFPWAVLTLSAGLIVPLLLLLKQSRMTFAKGSADLFGTDDIRVITVRLGTFTGLSYHFMMWLGRPPKPVPARPAARPAADPFVGPVAPMTMARKKATGAPLVVVWQSESFVDMRHFGVTGLALPQLDRMRGRAASYGRLVNAFEGGYTMRTEFAVITGLDPREIGPDSMHPYLRVGKYAGTAWPTRFKNAGWSTEFVHPHDRRFFRRHKALPLLGFEHMTMLDEFDHDRERDGPYVSDMALSERVLSICDEHVGRDGQLVFAASMENHGPWRPGRHGDSRSPVEIYCAILQRSDAALGFLADELDRLDRPVWLAFYGDHAPVMKSFADPFPDARTDYVIVPLGTAVSPLATRAVQEEKAAWHLLATISACLAETGEGPLAPDDTL